MLPILLHIQLLLSVLEKMGPQVPVPLLHLSTDTAAIPQPLFR